MQCNPLNGSPDHGSIQLIVQDLAIPILQFSLSKPLSDNGSIRLLVQFLAGPTEDPFSGLHCKQSSKTILSA